MRAGDSFAWRVIDVTAVVPQPWRNGGGLTRELLRVPDSPDWGCRISVAEIVADGEFSAYPGVDRQFAVIKGAGLTLALPDERLDCSPGHPPVRFDGAAATRAMLSAGPVTACNLMLAVTRADGRMGRVTERAPCELNLRGVAIVAVLALGPVALTGDRGAIHRLQTGCLHWTWVPTALLDRPLQVQGDAVVMRVAGLR